MNLAEAINRKFQSGTAVFHINQQPQPQASSPKQNSMHDMNKDMTNVEKYELADKYLPAYILLKADDDAFHQKLLSQTGPSADLNQMAWVLGRCVIASLLASVFVKPDAEQANIIKKAGQAVATIADGAIDLLLKNPLYRAIVGKHAKQIHAVFIAQGVDPAKANTLFESRNIQE